MLISSFVITVCFPASEKITPAAKRRTNLLWIPSRRKAAGHFSRVGVYDVLFVWFFELSLL
jgi:hypothetical protein